MKWNELWLIKSRLWIERNWVKVCDQENLCLPWKNGSVYRTYILMTKLRSTADV